MSLRYSLAALATEYYLSGIQQAYLHGKRVRSPRLVVWDCTRRCNLACLHCGAVKEHYSVELTTLQVLGILDQLASMKVRMFAVTGGEPLLREDLLPILAYAHKLGMNTGFATNGFFLDQEMAARIHAAGVDSVQVSLDGMQEIHTLMRGSPLSYTRAWNALENLIKANIPVVSVATTITCENVGELEDMKERLLATGVRLWRLAIVMPIGRAETRWVMPSADQLRSVLSFVRNNSSKKLRIFIGENLPFLGAWERSIRKVPLICPVGFLSCCIGVDGNVRGCPEQPDTIENQEGSLLTETFETIWNRGFQRFRRREILVTDPRCAQCDSQMPCFGGCWVMRTRDQHCIYDLIPRSK